MMKKIGAFFCIAGATLMLISFVSGLIKGLGGDFRGEKTFPIQISKTPLTINTENFSITGDWELAAWIKVPNRQIETQDFTVSVSFKPSDNTQSIDLSKEFGFWHTRSSFGDGQYYKIGSHRFNNGFEGKLLLETKGKWRPKYNASIILKKSKKSVLMLVLPSLGFFALGIVLLVLGIYSLTKESENEKF